MIKVTVPATSANLGPGFDCMGIALSLHNVFTFEKIKEGLIVEGNVKSFDDEDNLIYTSMKRCFEKIGYTPKGLRITSTSTVPLSRGLGSSATCIIGGILGANALAGNKLTKEQVLELATEIEGHPDNVAPALLGGCITAVMDNEKVYHSKINVPDGMKFYALIPNMKLATKKAREILPKEVSFEDAVYNLSRASLLTSALSNGEFELIKVAGKDRLHQQYRGELIDGYDSIIEVSEKAGAYGAFLSGAGPTILIAVDDKDKAVYSAIRKHVESLKYFWEIKELFIDNKGAKIEL